MKRVHRDMGHYGVHRVLKRLRKYYWLKGMDKTILQVIRAWMPCAKTKSCKELQPLALQGIMFRWVLTLPDL